MIDTDHRHLIELINSVEEALNEECCVRKLNTALNDLESYTREHFAREEEFMIIKKYVKYDAHKAAHRELIGELIEAAKPIRYLHSKGMSVLMEDAKNSLINLLRHWLLDHIIKEDMQLKTLMLD